MKRLLSIILSAVMIISAFSVLSFASSRPEDDPFSKSSFTAKDGVTQYVLTKESRKTGSGYPETRTYKYDSEGRLIASEETEDSNYYKYDSKGNLISDSFSGSGSNDYFKKYSYDSSLNLITSESSSEDWGNSKWSYKYDSSGRLIEKTEEDLSDYDYDFDDEEENYPLIYTYSYNSAGLLTKITGRSNGLVANVRTYKYNEDGLLTQMVYKSAGEVREKYTFKYNLDGELIKEIVNDDSIIEYGFKYNDDGSLAKKTCSEDGDSDATTYKYNAKGQLIKETYSTSGGYSFTTSYTYDSKGRLTKQVEAFDDGDKWTTVNSYDSNGNLVKTVAKRPDSPTVTTTYTYKKLSKPICVLDGKIRLSDYEVTYNGKARKPKVFIDGMRKGADYRVAYSNNVKPGKATITVSFNDPKIPPITITFFIRPAKVTGVKVSKTAKSSVSLQWTKTPKAEKYAVYKYVDKTGAYKKVATVTTNKATIKNLKGATVYKFCVKAIGGGIYSKDFSAKVKATTK